MELESIAMNDIEVSEFNARKNLQDGQQDSSVDDLARSIARQGLLSPITVFRKPDGRFGLVAGQRRFLACRQLGMNTIPAVVRDQLEVIDGTAISLAENLHRADMNPNDKISALTALLGRLGDERAVSEVTSLSVSTIRKYVQMQALAPELREQLAAGETRSTEALSRLARTFQEPEKQVEIWERIQGFTQDVQQDVIKRLNSDLDNLDEIVNRAVEGGLGYHVVRNCPHDCPTIPPQLKGEVARLIGRP